jgi:hypothetical protein
VGNVAANNLDRSEKPEPGVHAWGKFHESRQSEQEKQTEQFQKLTQGSAYEIIVGKSALLCFVLT